MPLRQSAQRPRRATPKLRARASTAGDYEVEDYEVEAEPNMRFSHALFVVLILHVIAVGGVFAFNSIKSRQTLPASGSLDANTSESRPKTSPPKAEPKASPASSHTVVKGDTLSGIASRHHTTIEALQKANGISPYSMIQVGQVLEIPKPGAAGKASVPGSEAVTQSAPVAKAAPEVKATRTEPIKSTVIPAKKEAFLAASKEVPLPKAHPAPEVKSPAPSSVGEAKPDIYVVEKGDNPYSIARRFHVSYKKLLEINEIKDPTKIQIGQKLKLPAQ